MVINDEHLESTDTLQEMIPNVLSDEELAAAAEAAAQKRQIAEARAEQWAQVAMATNREEQYYRQILALRNGSEPEGTSTRPRATEVANEGVHPVVAASIAVLETEGRPVHIGELMRLLQEQNIEIPGSGEQANLISYLRRDSRVVRPARGMYGLREWGLEDMEAPKRSTRRHKTTRRRRQRKQGAK